jgi:sugar phosphate permease
VEKLGAWTLKVGVAPSDLEETEHALRSVANRVGAAIIVVGLLLAAAILAHHDLRWEAFAGFVVAAVFGLYMAWKIIRTPGEL